MSLLGFGEISFDKNKSGPLEALSVNNFGTNTLRYPSDIGSKPDRMHYMIIYIRKQRNSKVQGLTEVGTVNSAGLSSHISNALSDMGPVGQEINNQVNGYLGQASAYINKGLDTAKNYVLGTLNNIFTSGSNYLSGISEATQSVIQNSFKQVQGASFQFMRTNRTTDAIALYMPDTIFFDHKQSYDTLNLGVS